MSWEAIIKNQMNHNQKQELIEKNKVDYYNETNHQ